MNRVADIEFRGQQDQDEIEELKGIIKAGEKEIEELQAKVQNQEVVGELKRRLQEMEEDHETMKQKYQKEQREMKEKL